MALTIHAFSGSPFSWTVQLTLEHKGIEYGMSPLNGGKGEHRSEAFLTLNPHGKVPVMEHDGFTLYESSAICEYLEDRFAEAPRLFPADVQARAVVRRWVAETHSVQHAAGFRIAQNVYFKPEDKWDLEMIEQGRAAVAEQLARYELAIEGDYLCGDSITAADYSLYPHLAHIARYELRKPDLELGDAIGTRTRGWMERIEALPYFDRTYPAHWKK